MFNKTVEYKVNKNQLWFYIVTTIISLKNKSTSKMKTHKTLKNKFKNIYDVKIIKYHREVRDPNKWKAMSRSWISRLNIIDINSSQIGFHNSPKIVLIKF